MSIEDSAVLEDRMNKLESRLAQLELKTKLDRRPREFTDITCTKCGKKDRVPFVPKYNREILCRECYQKNKGGK